MDSENCIAFFLLFLICVLTALSIIAWNNNKSYNIDDINPNFIQKSKYPQKESDRKDNNEDIISDEAYDVADDENETKVHPNVLAWNATFNQPGTMGRVGNVFSY